MSGVIRDMQDMMLLLKQQGFAGDSYYFDVPLSYARCAHAELTLMGFNLPYPDTGAEMQLDLKDLAHVVMRVH